MVVVEDDSRLDDAVRLVGRLRSAGFATEILATGSPRKRYDKAVKLSPDVVVSLAIKSGQPTLSSTSFDSSIGDAVARITSDFLFTSPRT